MTTFKATRLGLSHSYTGKKKSHQNVNNRNVRYCRRQLVCIKLLMNYVLVCYHHGSYYVNATVRASGALSEEWKIPKFAPTGKKTWCAIEQRLACIFSKQTCKQEAAICMTLKLLLWRQLYAWPWNRRLGTKAAQLGHAFRFPQTLHRPSPVFGTSATFANTGVIHRNLKQTIRTIRQ